MRLLKDAELFYVSGSSEATPAGSNHTDTTLMTRACVNDCYGWQSGGMGAASGNALYHLGKSFGWWC